MPNKYNKKLLDKYKRLGASRQYLDKEFIDFLNTIKKEYKFKNYIDASKYVFDIFIKKNINNVRLLAHTKENNIIEVSKGVNINEE